MDFLPLRHEMTRSTTCPSRDRVPWPALPPLLAGLLVGLLLAAFLTANPRPSIAQPVLFADVPGPRFPIELGHAENADFGDIDGDHDLDVMVACGGDFGPEPDRLFLNIGDGRFVEATA